jgi:hypothetical protein
MPLKVSDIIFLMDRKSRDIVPCRVIERVATTTLEGESIHHIIQPASGESLKLEDYNSPWFNNLEMAREFLLESAKSLIDVSINRASKARDKVFGTEKDDAQDPQASDIGDFLNNSAVLVQEAPDSVKIDLGNGQTASVTLPKGILDAENTAS